jgi:hypothetical protein
MVNDYCQSGGEKPIFRTAGQQPADKRSIFVRKMGHFNNIFTFKKKFRKS